MTTLDVLRRSMRVDMKAKNQRHGSSSSGHFPALWLRCVCVGLMVLLTAACSAQGDTDKTPAPGTTVWLTLHGYNYTDHYINDYFVDEVWGGNLFLSNETTGGGKSTCCVQWVMGQKLPVSVKVRWQSGGCIYKERVGGGVFERGIPFYTTKTVWVKGPIPSDPQYLETHIYPDGHVEVAVTDHTSPPRLKLPIKDHWRPGAKKLPKCTPEQLKQGEQP